MGMIAKAKTAARTAEKRTPITLGGDDMEEQLFGTDAVIRQVATDTGAVRRQSKTTRGSTPLLAELLSVGEIASDFWFERVSGDEWALALGADAVGGLKLDWSVRCRALGADSGPELSLVTTSALTADGTLVKGDVHDQLRQRITEGVAGTIQHTTSMTDVSEAGFQTPVAPLVAPPPESFHDEFTISTPLPLPDVELRARLVQARGAQGGNGWSYQIGIPGVTTATASVVVEDLGSHRELRVAVSYKSSGHVIGDAVAHSKATRFAAELLGTVKLWNAEAELTRSPENGRDGGA